VYICQWCSQGQNLMAETKASTFEAKAWTFEAKPFKHMARAELKIRITQCV